MEREDAKLCWVEVLGELRLPTQEGAGQLWAREFPIALARGGEERVVGIADARSQRIKGLGVGRVERSVF